MKCRFVGGSVRCVEQLMNGDGVAKIRGEREEEEEDEEERMACDAGVKVSR